MKQILLVSVLLLGGAWVAAQSTSDPGSSSGSSSQSGASQSGSSASTGQTGSSEAGGQMSAGSHHSVEGCLGGSDGKYTLTDKQGTTYTLTGDTSKLAAHVGHEVKISGGSGSDSSAASSASGSAGGQSLEVKSVKMVSKTCASGGGMAK